MTKSSAEERQIPVVGGGGVIGMLKGSYHARKLTTEVENNNAEIISNCLMTDMMEVTLRSVVQYKHSSLHHVAFSNIRKSPTY